jgi:GR25 family glycosyltransferase involved in LPS biosynthesis
MLGLLHGGRILAFGRGRGKIGMVLILNLDRQPQRLRRTLRELNRFKTFDGAPLTSLAQRLSAVDARDGCAVAATADVDQMYRLGDQLYVQPDARLHDCFGVDEPIRMTRQEVAVARSHIEAWKVIAAGPCDHVLVLEDDIWFRRQAAVTIDRGWRAATGRFEEKGGPRMLYLSYEDAGGTAARMDVCADLFRPKRGLWFLSGYILSREGAEMLLRSMPVVGPVDMWINYLFEEIGALALSSPAILQRPDGGSDNCYSVMPYLARAGIVDAVAGNLPHRITACPVLAWTAEGDLQSLPMALSMLGLRVRAFKGDELAIGEDELLTLLDSFDALVDAPLSAGAISAAVARSSVKFILEARACMGFGTGPDPLPRSRTAFLPNIESGTDSWQPLCALLDLSPPIEAFPAGPPRSWRIFFDDRVVSKSSAGAAAFQADPMDESPWVLHPRTAWPSATRQDRTVQSTGTQLLSETMTTPAPQLPGCVETFPGNLAAFTREGLVHDMNGTHFVLSKSVVGSRQYRSGAVASSRAFGHGRFEAEIRAARGSGVVTGFFLHRDSPRQEIDIELTGHDPHRMLVNVFFNPGDEGATVAFGYRGSPCRIELGFDATQDFHRYTIDWRPGCITWSVDGKAVHDRVGWDPTPIPHLPLRLHANLWAPCSEELAGRIDQSDLPSTATFRNVTIWT